MFNGPRHKIGLSSSALNQLHESVLIAQWQTEGELSNALCWKWTTLQIGIQRKPKTWRAGSSRSIISCFGTRVVMQEWFLPSLVLLWFPWCLSNVNHTKPHRTGHRAPHSPALLFLTLLQTPVYTRQALHERVEGASCWHTARTPSFSSIYGFISFHFSSFLGLNWDLISCFSAKCPQHLRKRVSVWHPLFML